MDVFDSFHSKCIETDELDPAFFLSALGVAWEACVKKTEVGLELLTGIDMLFVGIKGVMPYISTQKPTKLHEILWPKQIIFISHVLGFQKSIWIRNVTKYFCGWFPMEKTNA